MVKQGLWPKKLGLIFFSPDYGHSEKQEAGNKTPCNFRMFHYEGPPVCTALSLVDAGLASGYKDATTLPQGDTDSKQEP